MQASEVINLETLAVTNGTYVITARRGTLTGTYEGMASATDDPAVITYDVVGPITGGTGRFHHARGRLAFHGIGNLATGVLSDVANGWLIR